MKVLLNHLERAYGNPLDQIELKNHLTALKEILFENFSWNLCVKC